MRRNPVVLLVGICASTMAFGSGCTDSEGLDLAVRGRLSLYIDRESGSAQADVFGTVNDIKSFFFPVIVLKDDQVLTVNDVTIPHLVGFYGNEIAAVSAPSGYTVNFNNKGDSKSRFVTPPVDFAGVVPVDGSEVSRTGFDVTWTPSGDPEVRVDIKIRGFRKDDYHGDDDDDDDYDDYDRRRDDDDDPRFTAELISNLPDSGSVRIGEVDLVKFKNGEIELIVRRYRRFSGDMGFAETSIRVSNSVTRALMLTN